VPNISRQGGRISQRQKWNYFRKAQCRAASRARPAKTTRPPRRRQRVTRYFQLPFRPNTLVSLRARRGCKLVWTNTGQTKAMVQMVV
jgi:hypothetical protein